MPAYEPISWRLNKDDGSSITIRVSERKLLPFTWTTWTEKEGPFDGHAQTFDEAAMQAEAHLGGG